jgi:hypothetical protein
VELLCGKYHIEWQDLGDPIQYLEYGSGFPVLDSWIVMKESSVIWDELRRHEYWRPLESSLARIVRRFYKSRCSDPRDKIYGVLSMASEVDRSNFPVDYEKKKSMFEVMLDFWSYYVQSFFLEEEVRERRIPGLVWQLWMHMEVERQPSRDRFCNDDARLLQRLLDDDAFKLKASSFARVGDSRFSRSSLSTSDWSFWDNTAVFKFHSSATYSSSRDTSRSWLVISENLRSTDICFVAMSQPSDIFWEGRLETLPTQSMIIFRVNSNEFRCVGRGKEISPLSDLWEDRFVVQARFHPESNYALDPDYDQPMISRLLGGDNEDDLGEISPTLMLNAHAICEVMHTGWSIPDYLANNRRTRVRFEDRAGDGIPRV